MERRVQNHPPPFDPPTQIQCHHTTVLPPLPFPPFLQLLPLPPHHTPILHYGPFHSPHEPFSRSAHFSCIHYPAPIYVLSSFNSCRSERLNFRLRWQPQSIAFTKGGGLCNLGIAAEVQRGKDKEGRFIDTRVAPRTVMRAQLKSLTLPCRHSPSPTATLSTPSTYSLTQRGCYCLQLSNPVQ